jgi:lipopolysaccharide export system permease protein
MKKLIFKNFYIDTLSFFLTSLLTMSLIVWTLQAVNYFDFVTEDGHGLKIYFYYTFLSFPKILDRILPFMFFVSLFYTILSYEQKNELNIFWIYGISKIKFLNKLILFSIFLMFFQILLSSLISPATQFKARNFLKNSNVDFFSSLIKEGRFINVVKDLTIFINKKNEDGSYKDIFLNDSRNKGYKTIYAKKGILIDNGTKKIFRLYNGRVINKDQDKINVFEFDEIDFNLKNFSSNTITVPKIQEISTITLLSCFININAKKFASFKCDKNLLDEIKQELLKRLYKPLYIPLISLYCGFLLLNSRSKNNYQKKNNLIFTLTFIILVLSEMSLRYSFSSNIFTVAYFVLPLVIFIISYISFYRIVKNV